MINVNNESDVTLKFKTISGPREDYIEFDVLPTDNPLRIKIQKTSSTLELIIEEKEDIEVKREEKAP